MSSDWITYLERSGASFTDTNIDFPDTATVEGRCIAVPLVHLGLIRSVGDDSAVFLHNLVSNDVKKLSSDEAQWNSFNSPKGRMLASMLLWREADGHMLMVSRDVLPALLKKLSMYVLRSKVKLSDASESTVLIGLAGDNIESIVTALDLNLGSDRLKQAVNHARTGIRLDANTAIVAVPAEQAAECFEALLSAGALAAGTNAWQLAMIRAGLPLVTTATQEEFVAQMLNYELIGGVSFKKGCYPGQEIVARTQYLGKLKKRMYRVHTDAGEPPRAGEDIFTPAFGAQSAGKLVNVAPAPDGGFEALAVMQISCAESGEIRLGSLEGPRLTMLELPYSLETSEG